MDKEYIEPETKNVIGVQFSIMSPEEIRKRSVVEVIKHETYDKKILRLLKVYLTLEWEQLIWIKFVELVVRIILIAPVTLDILNLLDQYTIINLLI